MGRIPVKRLRWMAEKLSMMVREIDQHYPGALQEIADGRSDSMSETMRNIATAEAEIAGWITARIQGRRADPWVPTAPQTPPIPPVAAKEAHPGEQAEGEK